ncbi:hypothetical protein H5410_050615 [Solanum commersonii]|uniref:Uncharacterized protein n=1 Tax=Solanum commersonii TaxID=4109 RepID=A0A9J5WY44_SOLCO|nr:hypothetical protein H5410_050615 [Solanum commersonii]
MDIGFQIRYAALADYPRLQYEGTHIANLIKPVYLSNNYVDTDNPLKTQRYFEGILVNTESIIIEHTMSDKNPEYVSYSRFTIKRVLSPSKWYTNRLLTPITLLMPHKRLTYNWHDYNSAWFYIRPGHTWFVKYCPYMVKTVIPRWFYEWWSYFGGNRDILPQQFLNRFNEFQTKEEISTLPEHIKMCKIFLRTEFLILYLGTLLRQIKVSPKAASTSPSKNVLKERLKKALKEMDDNQSNEEDIMLLLEEVTSEKDNGAMLDPTGIALAYLDFY